MNALTDRQAEVLEMIEALMLKRGYPPTRRELADALGVASTYTVTCHLHALEKKGAIVMDPKVSRGLLIL